MDEFADQSQDPVEDTSRSFSLRVWLRENLAAIVLFAWLLLAVIGGVAIFVGLNQLATFEAKLAEQQRLTEALATGKLPIECFESDQKGICTNGRLVIPYLLEAIKNLETTAPSLDTTP